MHELATPLPSVELHEALPVVPYSVLASE